MQYPRLYTVVLAFFCVHAHVFADEPKKLEDYLQIEIKTANCFKDEKICMVKGFIQDKVLMNVLPVDNVAINQSAFVQIGQIETEKEAEQSLDTTATPSFSDSVRTASDSLHFHSDIAETPTTEDLRVKIKVEAILVDGKEFEITTQPNEELVFHKKFEKISMACHLETKNHPFIKLEFDDPSPSDGFDVENLIPYYQFDYYPERFPSGFTRHVVNGKLINMHNKKEIFGFTSVIWKTHKVLLFSNEGTLRSYAWMAADDSINFETQFPQFDPDGTPQTVYVTALREVFKQPTMVLKLSEIKQH